MENKIVVKNNTINKNFSYRKGNVQLEFSLRTDIKQQLKDFLELLKVAVTEVQEEINKK